MKTQDFIQKHKERIERGEILKRNNTARCASVMATNNTIYSYGLHYPLLFQIITPTNNKLWVCNNRGYSSTTAKHIAYSAYLADVCVDIGTNDGTERRTYENVLQATKDKMLELVNTMNSKKRKNTQVFNNLTQEYTRYTDYYLLLKK